MVQNSHSLAELPLAHSTSSLSVHTWTKNWNILVAANYSTSKSLFIDRAVSWLYNLTTCLYSLNCTSSQMIVHRSIFVVSLGIRKRSPV